MIRELITDADILSGRVRSPIVLGEGVRLTPAARDRAVARGIEIRESGHAAESRAAPAGGGCHRCGTASCSGNCASCASANADPALANLPDGTYLLRVEHGRAVAVHPASGPGLMPKGRAP